MREWRVGHEEGQSLLAPLGQRAVDLSRQREERHRRAAALAPFEQIASTAPGDHVGKEAVDAADEPP